MKFFNTLIFSFILFMTNSSLMAMTPAERAKRKKQNQNYTQNAPANPSNASAAYVEPKSPPTHVWLFSASSVMKFPRSSIIFKFPALEDQNESQKMAYKLFLGMAKKRLKYSGLEKGVYFHHASYFIDDEESKPFRDFIDSVQINEEISIAWNHFSDQKIQEYINGFLNAIYFNIPAGQTIRMSQEVLKDETLIANSEFIRGFIERIPPEMLEKVHKEGVSLDITLNSKEYAKLVELESSIVSSFKKDLESRIKELQNQQN